MVHSSSAVPLRPAAPFEKAIWKALRRVEAVAGLSHETQTQGESTEHGGMRVQLNVDLKSRASFARPRPSEAFFLLTDCLASRLQWRGLKWSVGAQFRDLTSTMGSAWSDLAEGAGGLAIALRASVRHPNDWDPIATRLLLWAAAAGFSVGTVKRGVTQVDDITFDVELDVVRAIEWLPTAADVATLLTLAIRAEGGPECDVSLEVRGEVLTGATPWADALRRAEEVRLEPIQRMREVPRPTVPAPGIHVVIIPIAARASATNDDDDSLEVVAALQRALRTAPRGYVGFKHFRDKLLRPGAPADVRHALLDAALEEGLVRMGRVVDTSTGLSVATLEPNPEHPMVAASLRAASGELPELVVLRGEPLSATVIAARETER